MTVTNATVTNAQLVAADTGGQVAVVGRGVIVRDAKKKGKKRYSRPLKAVQKRMDGMLRVSNRLSSAISKGIVEFRDRSNKSSKKKKDGMLRDLFKNSAEGVGETLRVSSRLPGDFIKVLRPKWFKR
jgi:hypothetical protein